MHTLLIEGRVKPGKKSEFITTWNREILPMLKKQPGFVDEILLFGTAEQESGVGISMFKTREDAERYHREVFPRQANTVQHLMIGPPTVRQFNVEASETFRIAAKAAA
jgi:heme-degrading monooxygenase HmoA